MAHPTLAALVAGYLALGLLFVVALGGALLGCHAERARTPSTGEASADTPAESETGTSAAQPGAPTASTPTPTPTPPTPTPPPPARATVIEVRFTDASFAWLHPELEEMLRQALQVETQRCPGLSFAVRVGYTNYAMEHWVYEAATYLLVFVAPEQSAAERASAGGHFFMLWPGHGAQPMSGATLVLGRAASGGAERAAVEPLVQAAVQHAVDEIASAYRVACR